MSRRNAVLMTDEQYLEEHFSSVSCPCCYAHAWIEGTSSDDRTKYVGPTERWYGACLIARTTPCQCGKRP